MDISDITKQLKAQKCVAIYNIFSQQALQKFFMYLAKNKTAPFELPGIPDVDSSIITIDSYFKMLQNMGLEPVTVKRAANSFITRNWFKETFRYIQKEVKIHLGLEAKLRQQDWYQFTRLLANGLSHDNKWTLFDHKNKPKAKAKLPVTYRDLSITPDMHGKDISLKLQVIFEITEDIIKFFESQDHNF